MLLWLQGGPGSSSKLQPHVRFWEGGMLGIFECCLDVLGFGFSFGLVDLVDFSLGCCCSLEDAWEPLRVGTGEAER